MGEKPTPTLSQTTADVDPMKKVLFMKAYTLERLTIRGGARGNTDVEAAAGEGTSHNGASAEAEVSDEKSERHEATLSVDSKDRDHTPVDNTDDNSHAKVTEKM